MSNRKYGAALLQSFAQGPSLIDPNHVGMLRALAEDPNGGMIASMTRTIAGALGVTAKQLRDDAAVSPDAMCSAMGVSITDRTKPFAFSDGLAIIPVWGALLHRDGWCDSSATGYDFIRAQFDRAMADPDVKGLVFDMNSPGGHVAGNFELADDIYTARSIKPSIAIIDTMCYSGGYSLGSAMTRMVATPSGGAGSIGVVMMHVSIEALLKEYGVEINFIHAGAHKVDGNMFAALPDDVRARFQAAVGRSYDKFVSLVARNRGMDPEAVRATEALCYDAEEALSLGLIDAVQAPKDALADFRKELSGSPTNPTQGAKKMTTETATPPGGATVDAPATPPAAAAVVPAAAATVEAPAVDTAAAAVKADRERGQAIMSCDEAKGREELARHFALETDMSVDAAKKALGLSPKANTSATSPFVAAMDNGDQPNVGATDGASKTGEQSVAQRIAANFHGATGGTHKRAT